MIIMTILLASTAVVSSAPTQQTPRAQKVEVVAVTGCLKQQGTANDWILVKATDPVATAQGHRCRRSCRKNLYSERISSN